MLLDFKVADRIANLFYIENSFIKVDYIQLNQQLSNPLLNYFIDINELDQTLKIENKEKKIKDIKEKLEIYNLSVLPILLINLLNSVYCLPLIVKNLKSIPESKKQLKSSKPAQFKKSIAKLELKTILKETHPQMISDLRKGYF